MPTKKPTRRTAGRPRKLTGALRRRILSLIRGGVTSTRAAGLAGIHPDTLGRWTREKSDFAEEVEAAREASTGFLEQQVAQACRRDWRAAAWLLERRHPAEYGRPGVRAEVTATVDIEGILSMVEQRRGAATTPATTPPPAIPPGAVASPPTAPTPAPAPPPARASLTVTLESLLPPDDLTEG